MDTVSYQVGRSQIKDGDLVFLTDHTIAGFLIRLFTRTKYSHCNIAFWDQTPAGPRILAVESQGGTTRRIINLSFYTKKGSMDIISSPKDWTTVVAPVALQQLGFAKYGYFEALYVGLREFLLKYLDIKISEKAVQKSEICSEFMARVIQWPDTEISPGLLAQQLIAAGNPVKLMIARTE